MSDKFLVIDGSSLIHRAFFALPPLTTRKGQHTGAVYGFLRMFHKLLQDVKPRWVAAAFDKSRITFRTKLYADYKGQRKPTPPEHAAGTEGTVPPVHGGAPVHGRPCSGTG